jgi:outer membrane protein assembly factor BamB
MRTKTSVVGTCLVAALAAAPWASEVGHAADGNGPAAAAPTARGGPLLGSPDFYPSPQRPIGWRADGSGIYPAAQPVATWSAKKNLLWTANVGTGCSSPVLVGNRVVIAAEPDLLVCVDAATGKELWRKAHKISDLPAELNAKAPNLSEHYGDATPTAVSDGKWVWVFFNAGIVACHDLQGKNRWMTWHPTRLATSYGRTASPVLVGNRLLVHFGPLLCLDASTGKLLWQNDKAKASYGTPAIARIGGVDVAITPKGHVVRVADGKTLAERLGSCGYVSPVVHDGVVYFIDRTMSAVQLPEKAGDEMEGKELWCEDLEGDFFASPLVCGGRVYAVDRAANYYVIDARTGKTLMKKTLDLPPAGRTDGPNVYSSLCLAGKHVLVGNDAGDMALLEPGDRAAVAGTNSLGAGSGATPTFSGKRMFVRGGKLLYCIGE